MFWQLSRRHNSFYKIPWLYFAISVNVTVYNVLMFQGTCPGLRGGRVTEIQKESFADGLRTVSPTTWLFWTSGKRLKEHVVLIGRLCQKIPLPRSGKTLGKFHSDQKSWKSQGIVNWVRGFLEIMWSREKVRQLYICHCEPWKFESNNWVKWNLCFWILNWRRLIHLDFVFIVHD